jgi:phosphoribosylaminoimidazole-succinocarboxamide synthase
MKQKTHPKRKIYTMAPRKPIYEGKAKQLFEGPEPGTLIQHFKDDATAFNNEKKGSIAGKGVLNNRISEYLMLRLHDMGIPTHFIRTLNMREQLIKQVQIVPLEVIVRNYAAGSFSKRFGVTEGKMLGHPLLEYSYKNDALGDPFVTEEHIFAFGWATPSELDEIRMYAFRINDFLSGLFAGIGIRLVDFKLEFGRLYENDREQIILADEISPDNCRLWDLKTGHKLDKDRFRQDLGKIEDAYREVAQRLGVMPENGKDSYVIQVNAKAPKKSAKTTTKKKKSKVKK